MCFIEIGNMNNYNKECVQMVSELHERRYRAYDLPNQNTFSNWYGCDPFYTVFRMQPPQQQILFQQQPLQYPNLQMLPPQQFLPMHQHFQQNYYPNQFGLLYEYPGHQNYGYLPIEDKQAEETQSQENELEPLDYPLPVNVPISTIPERWNDPKFLDEVDFVSNQRN